MALTFASMFSPGTSFWDLAGAVTQPIFAGGTLSARERAARAAYEQAMNNTEAPCLLLFRTSPIR
jgi:outer membrane protein TolC